VAFRPEGAGRQGKQLGAGGSRQGLVRDDAPLRAPGALVEQDLAPLKEARAMKVKLKNFWLKFERVLQCVYHSAGDSFQAALGEGATTDHEDNAAVRQHKGRS